MGFFSGITKAVGGLLGGGKSSSTSQATNVSTNQNFAPVNNINTDVNVDIDIDKLADAIENGTANNLFIAEEQNKLSKVIAEKQLYFSQLNANKSYNLDKSVAIENSNIKKTEKEIKEEELKLSSLSLKEKKLQNERMTWIAITGVIISLGGVVWSNAKRSPKK